VGVTQGTSTAADVRAEAFQRAGQWAAAAAWGTTAAGGVYITAYVTATTGAFEDTCVCAVDRAAAFAAARAAHDAAVDRDAAAAAVISVYVDEAVAACRRDAAAAAISETIILRRQNAASASALEEVERNILELIDERGGVIPVACLRTIYEKRFGRRFNARIARTRGFEYVSSLLRSLPGIAFGSAQTISRATVSLATVEREILVVLNAHHGVVRISLLGEYFQVCHGKTLDHNTLGFERLSHLLAHLPGVSPGVSWKSAGALGHVDVCHATAPGVVRILQLPAAASTLAGDAAEFQPEVPAPATSRSASPDPTAAPWTPAPPMPFPYGPPPPGAYYHPPPPHGPPPGGYFMHPFMLQPLPPAQTCTRHNTSTPRNPHRRAAYKRAVANAKYPAGSRGSDLGPAAPAGWVDGGRGYDV